MLGILGGMGPIATIDFLRYLNDLPKAEVDQDHVAYILYSDPSIPDRSDAIRNPAAPSPFDAMVRGLRTLEAAGARIIAIPCNTAHHWHGRLSQASSVPILNMIELTIEFAVATMPAGSDIGLLATRGTLAVGLYQNELARRGFCCTAPTDDEAANSVDDVVGLTKAGRLVEARVALSVVLRWFSSQGIRNILFGCTEIAYCWSSIAGDGLSDFQRIINPTQLLAKECCDRSRLFA